MRPSTLLPLKLYAPTLFFIVSSANPKRPTNLYNFNNEVIRSRQVATRSKYAVFVHNMMILPECETLRANGYLGKFDRQSSEITPLFPK